MKIVDFGYSGEGVAKENGKVCFVPYTLIGEEVEVSVTKERPSFCQCELKKIILSSPKRQIPPCPYFSKCGGCDFQHMTHADELELKKEIAKRQLKKVGYSGDIEIFSCNEYAYRNKIKLFCNGKGLGLKRAQTNEIINIKKCLLIDEKMNFLLEKINFFILSNQIQRFVDNIIIKKFYDQDAVKFELNKDLGLDYIGLSLVFGDNVSIFQSINRGQTQLMQGEQIALVESGIKTLPSVDAFRQVNDLVAQKLYDDIIENASGVIINAYSGAGALSARLAAVHDKVYGIELGSAEHESAEKLKIENNISNLENICGDCADEIPKIKNSDTIIVDPPRAGCDERVVSALSGSGARQIIYVSCNIATLVRDLQRLDGYIISYVTLYDMFPRTANFEIMVKLCKKQ